MMLLQSKFAQMRERAFGITVYEVYCRIADRYLIQGFKQSEEVFIGILSASEQKETDVPENNI